MAKGIKVTTGYRDQAGKGSTNTLFVATGLTLAQYDEGLKLLAPLLDDVTGAVIDNMAFTQDVDISAITGNTPAGSSDVQDVGAFGFRTTENRPVNINVPGILDTLSVAGSDDLDQVDADVSAFISAIEDGLVTAGGTIIPTDVDEDDIATLIYAREEVRNSGSRG